jgi:hypothetical protein
MASLMPRQIEAKRDPRSKTGLEAASQQRRLDGNTTKPAAILSENVRTPPVNPNDAQKIARDGFARSVRNDCVLLMYGIRDLPGRRRWVPWLDDPEWRRPTAGGRDSKADASTESTASPWHLISPSET